MADNADPICVDSPVPGAYSNKHFDGIEAKPVICHNQGDAAKPAAPFPTTVKIFS